MHGPFACGHKTGCFTAVGLARLLGFAVPSANKGCLGFFVAKIFPSEKAVLKYAHMNLTCLVERSPVGVRTHTRCLESTKIESPLHRGLLKHSRLFAKADLDLILKGASPFTAGQAYKVDFHLVVPESPPNRDAVRTDDFLPFTGWWYACSIGVLDTRPEPPTPLLLDEEEDLVTKTRGRQSLDKLTTLAAVRLRMLTLGEHGLPKQKRFACSFVLYQPSIIDLMDTLMFSPFYLFRIWRKEQQLVIRLHEAFVDNWELPSVRAEVHLSADHLHWYSSRLVVNAVFNPLTKILNSHTWVFCLIFMVVEMLIFNLCLLCFVVIRYHKTVFVACVAFLSNLVPGGAGSGPHRVSVSTQTTVHAEEIEEDDQDPDKLPKSVHESPAALTLSATAETQRTEDDDSPILILGTDSSSDSF
ncbi:unnamed protein product [Schistocephalus solidus]|uniref:Seipin n=1 Tax=Schistocephalus solidus TaxID=70667 RepID=A0A183TE56_SCHSO|nr:unnamed protein product [Schistocephalus solidus]